ncbi:MAG: homoserine kinase [Firmicutes bacterium]|jgi:homoserine kinase|nr:homoserine kinase [Bacillota bacterium]
MAGVRVKVSVPATSANLGSGFDSLGIALGLEDEFVFELGAGQSGVVLLGPEGVSQHARIPTGRDNLSIRAFEAAYAEAGQRAPEVMVTMANHIPVARGLGSSAAGIVAGTVAANEFMGRPLDRQAMLNLAAKLEGHPDNTTACMLGGLTASALVGSRTLWARLPLPPGLGCVVVVPDFQVSTSSARNVLPSSVQYSDAVFNVSRAALLVASLATGAYQNLRYAMEDRLHQPYRSALVPGLFAAVRAGLDAGALGVAMSGAGPSVLALVGEGVSREVVGQAIVDAFRQARVTSRAIPLPITSEGARVSYPTAKAGGLR